MSTSLKCPNCGAPVRWRGEAPVVACRYCDTHVATGTGRKTQEPAVVRSQMRPRNVAAVTGASVLLPVIIAVAGGLIAFLGSQSGELFAVKVATAKEVWRTELGGAIETSPWPADGVVYVSCDDGNVYALEDK